MRVPGALTNLIDEGIIDEVVRPLMSGKEAQVYLVLAGGAERVAKVYKEAQNRTFKHRTSYTEGRKVRNSRDQRAISKRSKYGRAEGEAAWRSTEVDMIYRLQAAGVRVPAPYQFIDGVLIMELVTSAGGHPAPRLCDGEFTAPQAVAFHAQLLGEAVKMLCAGVVHGDLSEFNVLIGADGPVVIDFPQAIDASKNRNARSVLIRDVANLNRFLSRYVPAAHHRPYAEEMWALYESSRLAPDTVLRGHFRSSTKKANTDALLELVQEVTEDERRRRVSRGQDTTQLPPRRRRVEVVVQPGQTGGNRPAASRGRRPPARSEQSSAQPAARTAGTGRPARSRRAPGSSGPGSSGPRSSELRSSEPGSSEPGSSEPGSSGPRSSERGPSSGSGPPHSPRSSPGSQSTGSSYAVQAGGSGAGASPSARRRRRRRRPTGPKTAQ